MSEVLQWCDGLPQKAFETGDILLEEGKRTGLVYVLIEGEIEILRGDVQIETSTLSGAVFGEMSILLDEPHTATVRTLAPSRFLVIDRFKEYLTSNTPFCLHLCRMMARRLSNMTTYLVDLKEQFADQDNHLNMVDEVLGTLLHHQEEKQDKSS